MPAHALKHRSSCSGIIFRMQRYLLKNKKGMIRYQKGVIQKEVIMSPRIFIVDDSESCIYFMVSLLESEGFSNVRTFSKPSDAISAVHDGDIPSMVITDFEMPECNGVTLLNTLASINSSLSGIVISVDVNTVLNLTKDFPVLDKSKYDFCDQLLHCVKNVFELVAP